MNKDISTILSYSQIKLQLQFSSKWITTSSIYTRLLLTVKLYYYYIQRIHFRIVRYNILLNWIHSPSNILVVVWFDLKMSIQNRLHYWALVHSIMGQINQFNSIGSFLNSLLGIIELKLVNINGWKWTNWLIQHVSIKYIDVDIYKKLLVLSTVDKIDKFISMEIVRIIHSLINNEASGVSICKNKTQMHVRKTPLIWISMLFTSMHAIENLICHIVLTRINWKRDTAAYSSSNWLITKNKTSTIITV